MAVDVARIGVEIEARGAEEASRKLEQFEKQASKTANAANDVDAKLARFFQNTEEGAKKLSDSDKALERLTQRYTQALDPLEKYRRQVEEVNRLGQAYVETNGRIGLSADQVVKAHQRIRQEILASKDASRAALDAGLISGGDLLKGPLAMAGVLGAATVAVTGLVKLFGAVTAEIIETEKETARLNALMEITGRNATVSAAGLNKMVEELQQVSGFDDNAIRRAAGTLATFLSVQGSQFEQTLRLGADLAHLMGTDITGAVQILGRALEDPERGMMNLRRAGIVLTNTQRDLVKDFMAVGDAASAQQVILDAVSAKVGGLSEKMNVGLTGAIKNVRVAWDGLLDSLGQATKTSFILEGALSAVAASINLVGKAVKDADLEANLVGGLNPAAGMLIRAARGRQRAQQAGAPGSLENEDRLDRLARSSTERQQAELRRQEEVNRRVAELDEKSAGTKKDYYDQLRLIHQKYLDDVSRGVDQEAAFEEKRKRVMAVTQDQPFFRDAERKRKEAESKSARASREAERALDSDRRASERFIEQSSAVEKYLASLNEITRLEQRYIETQGKAGLTADQSAQARSKAAHDLGVALDREAEARDKAMRADHDATVKQEESLQKRADAFRKALDPMQKYYDQLDEINALTETYIETQGRFGFSEVEAAQHRARVLNDIYEDRRKQNKEITDEQKDAKEMAEAFGFTLSSSFEEALSKGADYRKLLQGIEEDIIKIINRQLLTKPFSDFITKQLEGLGGGGGLGGIFGSIFKRDNTDYAGGDIYAQGMPGFGGGEGTASQNILATAAGWLASLFKFQHGGEFTIGGGGGPDSKLVSFWGSPGERVSVAPPWQQAQAPQPAQQSVAPVTQHNTFVIQGGTDRRSQEQIAAGVFSATSRAARRNL